MRIVPAPLREASTGARRFLELEILRRLPRSWAMHWMRFVGRARYWLVSRNRRNATNRMRRFFPEASSGEVRRKAQESLVNNTIKRRLNYLLMGRRAEDFRDATELEGWEHLQEAVALGKGVVLLASHVGMPRLLRYHLRTTDYRVLYLVRMGFPRAPGSPGPVGQWFEDRLRTRHCVDADELMGEQGLSLQYMKKAHDHLKRNGLVYITGDGRQGERSFSATICGREVEFRLGGIALALMSGATILPCFTTLDSCPRFRVQIQAPLRWSRDAPRSEQFRSVCEAYVARLEEEVLGHPTNVFVKGYVPQAPDGSTTTRDPSLDRGHPSVRA